MRKRKNQQTTSKQMMGQAAGVAVYANDMGGVAATPQQPRAVRILRNIGITILEFLGWLLLIGGIVFLIAFGFVNISSSSAKAQLAEGVSEDAVSTVFIGDTELYTMDGTPLLATGDNTSDDAEGAYVPPLPVDFAEGIEEWDESDMNYLFSSVPPQVYDILAPRGWKIHVVHDVKDSGIPLFDPDLTSIDGLTCGFTKEIWIIPAAGTNLFSHEIGHAIDWELGFQSLTPEFIGIASACENVMSEKEELENSLDPTFIGTVSVPSSIKEICTRSKINEKWATAFALYCTSPVWLLRDYPDCYLHFAKLFGVRGMGGNSGSDSEYGATDATEGIKEMIDSAIAEANIAPKAEYARAMERPWGEYDDDELNGTGGTLNDILERLFGLYDAADDAAEDVDGTADGAVVVAASHADDSGDVNADTCSGVWAGEAKNRAS